MSIIAVLDANVLYPAPLRDLLLRLAVTDIFLARWTDEIHDEWIRNVATNRADLKLQQLHRTRDLMNANVRNCLVTEYAHLIEGLTLPDPDDRHVLAAALKCSAQAIVTFNLKDFPKSVLKELSLYAVHPDKFVEGLLDSNPGLVCSVVKKHREALRKPPKSINQYLDTLESCGLAITTDRLRHFAANL